MKFLKLAACITSASLLIACGADKKSSDSPIQRVLNTNADIAYAAYTDSVKTAEDLKTAISAFKAAPTAANLKAAKKAWLISREPYGQTEVYRFRSTPIDDNFATSAKDDGPEGSLNAWPLGEALIDYVVVESSDFGTSQVGVTANGVGIGEGGGKMDVAYIKVNSNDNIIGNVNVTINADLLAKSAGAEDEHDVIAGYHAIEFILWGQDLKKGKTGAASLTAGTDRAEAVNSTDMGGQRPLTDFTTETNAARRHLFLEVAVDKLIADLKQVQAGWAKGNSKNYRASFTKIANEADGQKKLAQILVGMGSLSQGELAGERMQIAFSSNSQEDEHSCFSDNTHRDIWLNAEGVSNSFTGDYAGYDSTLDGVDNVKTNAINGYGIDDYLASKGFKDLSAKTATALKATEVGYTAIDKSARDGMPFDVLIQKDKATNTSDVAKTIIALSAQSRVIQEVADKLKLKATVAPDDGTACDTQNPTKTCG